MSRLGLAGKMAVLFFFIFLFVHTNASAEDAGLIGLISSKIGVSQEQAQGGVGAIFKLAKQNLSEKDYGSIAEKIPGIEKMIGSAPEPKERSGLFDSFSSMFGSSSDKLEGMADLKSSFQKLGLSGDMVGKFLPIILGYIKEKGGEKLMDSLKGALL